ncbi:SRPBCC family protein [Actinopolymorpha pittospori]
MTENAGYPYTLTRSLDVPVAAVWKAWTDPEQYTVWAHAVPGSVQMDVRPGGKWTAVMSTPGGDFPLAGSFLEVKENERLVLAMGAPDEPHPAVMTADFTAQGEQSTLVVSQTCASEEERDMTQQGSTMLLDGLTAFLHKS